MFFEKKQEVQYVKRVEELLPTEARLEKKEFLK